MLSQGKGFIVLFKDLESNLCKKEYYNDCTEYWCYRKKEFKSKIWLPDRVKKLFQDKQDTFLFAIIVCSGDHIRFKNKLHMRVEGLRITGDSINNYLKKTNRHVD